MTINITELRRLAQAATPGPWINHGRQPNVAGLPHSAVAAKTLLARVYSEAYGDVEQETANASFIAAANPATISELLDRLEAAESDALEQARLNGMGGEREAALMAKLEAAEKSDAESIAMYRRARDERDALRALVVMRFDHDYPPQFTQGHDLHELTEPVTAEHCRWFVAEIERLRTACDALREKIACMERQEPVAYLYEYVFSQSFTDREWRSESGTWAAAWKAAKRHEAQAQPAPSVPEGWKLVPIEPTPGMMRGAHRLVAAARRVLASADSQGLIRLDESGDVASELRSALEAAPEAKP